MNPDTVMYSIVSVAKKLPYQNEFDRNSYSVILAATLYLSIFVLISYLLSYAFTNFAILV